MYFSQYLAVLLIFIRFATYGCCHPVFFYFSCQVDALRADLYDKIEANDIDSKNRDKGDFLKQDGNRKWLKKSSITLDR